MYCIVLHCIAVCCSTYVLAVLARRFISSVHFICSVLQCVLQCIAVRCSVWQCVEVLCSVLQSVRLSRIGTLLPFKRALHL